MTAPDPLNIALVSLGCAKNMVDAECMSQILAENGHRMVDDPAQAQVLVVNTCGFIESAKREAIETILQLADYKKPIGPADFLVVTGCLAERYRSDLRAQMPEVDAVLGVSEYADIAAAIDRLYASLHPSFEGSAAPGLSQKGGRKTVETNREDTTIQHSSGKAQETPERRLAHLRTDRRPSTVGHAYIKIAEGCSNCCTYCAIPGIRGAFISRPFEEIVEEARQLSLQGFAELILIAQDTTRYGMDRTGRRELPELLRAIASLDSVQTIRILYVYADGITNELIDTMAAEPKILHYLDLPIQHASDVVLKRMNRRDTQASIRQVIRQLRAAMPDIVLRSTVMVGFPGETVREFNELLSFLKEIRFDRLGCFVFSPEEGTPANAYHPRVRHDVAQRRADRVMAMQQAITLEGHERRIGTIVPVLLEQVDEDGIFYRGRSYGEAPDVDPVIRVAAADEKAEIGMIVPVRVLAASEYEMTGETVL